MTIILTPTPDPAWDAATFDAYLAELTDEAQRMGYGVRVSRGPARRRDRFGVLIHAEDELGDRWADDAIIAGDCVAYVAEQLARRFFGADI